MHRKPKRREEPFPKTNAVVSHFHELNDAIKAAEARLSENLAMQKHIQNYAKTKEVYAAYRKSGYSKVFYEEHRAEITLHKAAKDAFDAADGKVPTIKELRAEYAQVLNRKKADYREYREARQLMQEMLRAQKNVEMFYGEEHRTELEEARHRSEEKQK